MSPGALGAQLVDGVEDRLGLVALACAADVRLRSQLAGRVGVARLVGACVSSRDGGRCHQGSVADLDGVGTAGHDVRRRVVEVTREPGRVDRRRGDEDVQVWAAGQQRPEVAEQEVDGEAALVGLVDDDRVVGGEVTVVADLGEQYAVGHHLHQGARGGAVGEPDLVAHRVTERDVELLGDALGDAAGGDPPRLGLADQPAPAAAGLQAQLRQLGRLARTGLPGHDDDLVVAQCGHQVRAVGDHG